MAGWGATAVDYANTQCGYKKAITNPDSVSTVLKKLHGIRYQVTNIKLIVFLLILISIYSPRFSSLEDCYDIYDDIFTPYCSSAKIDTERNIHICASSLVGDICNGDGGSGLAILDKLNK